MSLGVGVMLSALIVLVAVSQSPDLSYFPATDRVSWQLAHYKHVHPITGRVVVSPAAHEEYFARRRWSTLTPAQQMRPEYRGLILAGNRITDPIVYLRFSSVGVQLVPGAPQDEMLTDSRLIFGGGL